jgi:hypothetical protein
MSRWTGLTARRAVMYIKVIVLRVPTRNATGSNGHHEDRENVDLERG